MKTDKILNKVKEEIQKEINEIEIEEAKDNGYHYEIGYVDGLEFTKSIINWILIGMDKDE